MHNFRLLCLGLGLSCALFGGTITRSYTGTVQGQSTSIDTYGYFGTAGADLAGSNVSFGFSYTPSGCTNINSSGDETLYPCTAGSVAASITINGITLSSVGNSSFDNVTVQQAGGGTRFALLSMDADHIVNPTLYYTDSFAADILLTGLANVDNGTFSHQVNVGGPGFSNQDLIHIINVTSESAATPEPSTMLLLAGAGSLLFFRRRR